MLSIYIHIPFCNNICSYCDFNKVFYNKKLISNYLEQLRLEIQKNYKNEKVKTIYIGGGTPSSLSYTELNELLNITNIFNKSDDCEITIECNPENMDSQKISLLKKNGVNRVSIGVQSFNWNVLKLLNRNHTKEQVFSLIQNLKNIGINNINIDLMFGVREQSLDDIRNDLAEFLKLDIPHLSYYSLILEEHTKLYIDNYQEIDDDIIASQYDFICEYLKNNGYNHYEISNFSKPGYSSMHNLTYWNNEYYYGFGCGAHGYIDDIRYENTRSITKYIDGKYRLFENKISLKENMENEIMLGFRKLDGINKGLFYNKFNKQIDEVFKFNVLIEKGLIKEVDNKLFIPEKHLFISNAILTQLLMDGDLNDRK